MMNRTFGIISLHFADFLSHDWVSWFTLKLVPLLPSLTAEMLQTVTQYTDCSAYRVVYVALLKCQTALQHVPYSTLREKERTFLRQC